MCSLHARIGLPKGGAFLMKVWIGLFAALLGWSTNLAAKVLTLEPATSRTTLAHDSEMEEFVELLFRMAGKPEKVPVVIDPAAKPYCGFAAVRDSRPYIGIDRACVGMLRSNGVYRWSAVGTLAHEAGH